MVTCCAARALASRSVLFASLVATFAASAVSQSSGVPTPGVPTPGVTAAAKPVPAAPDVTAVTAEPKAPTAQKAAPVFGKVVGEEVAVRCWASAVVLPIRTWETPRSGPFALAHLCTA